MHRATHRFLSTQAAGPTFAQIKNDLLNRPPRIYHDILTPNNSNLLSISLSDTDHDRLRKSPARSLPQGHHLVYFPPTHPTSLLLPDGTDRDHFPGEPFTRRLWASGSLTFHQPQQLVLDGKRAACIEMVENVDLQRGGNPKDDKTPKQIFVTIDRQYKAAEQLPSITEKRVLCFLPAKTPEEAQQSLQAPPASQLSNNNHTPDHTLSISISRNALFRFSALSFNAHAIHLDRDHCRQVEGYRDLLVHGPLLLVLMCKALTEALLLDRDPMALSPFIQGIEYRNLRPVFVDEDIRVCVKKSKEKGRYRIWVVAEGDIRVTATATASSR